MIYNDMFQVQSGAIGRTAFVVRAGCRHGVPLWLTQCKPFAVNRGHAYALAKAFVHLPSSLQLFFGSSDTAVRSQRRGPTCEIVLGAAGGFLS